MGLAPAFGLGFPQQAFGQSQLQEIYGRFGYASFEGAEDLGNMTAAAANQRMDAEWETRKERADARFNPRSLSGFWKPRTG